MLIDPKINGNGNFGPPRLATVVALRPATRNCGAVASSRLERAFIKAPPRPPTPRRPDVLPTVSEAMVIVPIGKFRVGDVVMWVPPGAQLPQGLMSKIPEVWNKTCPANAGGQGLIFSGVVQLKRIGDHISDGVIFDLSDVRFKSASGGGPPSIEEIHGFVPPPYFYYPTHAAVPIAPVEPFGRAAIGVTLTTADPGHSSPTLATHNSPVFNCFCDRCEKARLDIKCSRYGFSPSSAPLHSNATIGDNDAPLPPVVGCTCSGCHAAQDVYDAFYGWKLKPRAGCNCQRCMDRVAVAHAARGDKMPIYGCECAYCREKRGILVLSDPLKLRKPDEKSFKKNYREKSARAALDSRRKAPARAVKMKADMKSEVTAAVGANLGGILQRVGKNLIELNTPWPQGATKAPMTLAEATKDKMPMRYPDSNVARNTAPSRIVSAAEVRAAMPAVERKAADIFAVEREARELCKVRGIDPNSVIGVNPVTNPTSWRMQAWPAAAIEILEARELLWAVADAEGKLAASENKPVRIVAVRPPAEKK